MSDTEDIEQEPYEIQYDGEENKRTYLSKDGKAKAVFPNEDTYEGSYAGGQRNGHGKYTWVKGGEYTGAYVNGKKHGIGTFVYPDKSVYVGEWANDQRHGRGTYTYPNGDKYCGQWVNGIKQGTGTYLYAHSQTQLTGEFINGICTDGEWTYYDGKPFVGQVHKNVVVKYVEA